MYGFLRGGARRLDMMNLGSSMAKVGRMHGKVFQSLTVLREDRDCNPLDGVYNPPRSLVLTSIHPDQHDAYHASKATRLL